MIGFDGGEFDPGAVAVLAAAGDLHLARRHGLGHRHLRGEVRLLARFLHHRRALGRHQLQHRVEVAGVQGLVHRQVGGAGFAAARRQRRAGRGRRVLRVAEQGQIETHRAVEFLAVFGRKPVAAGDPTGGGLACLVVADLVRGIADVGAGRDPQVLAADDAVLDGEL